MQIQRVLRGIFLRSPVLRSTVFRSVLVWSGALVSVSSLAHGHGLPKAARLHAASALELSAAEHAPAPAPASASSEAVRQVVVPDLLSPQSGDDDGDDGDGDGDGDDGSGDDDGSEAQPL